MKWTNGAQQLSINHPTATIVMDQHMHYDIAIPQSNNWIRVDRSQSRTNSQLTSEKFHASEWVHSLECTWNLNTNHRPTSTDYPIRRWCVWLINHWLLPSLNAIKRHITSSWLRKTAYASEWRKITELNWTKPFLCCLTLASALALCERPNTHNCFR